MRVRRSDAFSRSAPFGYRMIIFRVRWSLGRSVGRRKFSCDERCACQSQARSRQARLTMTKAPNEMAATRASDSSPAAAREFTLGSAKSSLCLRRCCATVSLKMFSLVFMREISLYIAPPISSLGTARSEDLNSAQPDRLVADMAAPFVPQMRRAAAISRQP